MNPRQEQWALFFIYLFNFHLSYCLESKNIKADALCCQYEVKGPQVDPVSSLDIPDHHVTLQWELGYQIHQVHILEPPPAETMPG